MKRIRLLLVLLLGVACAEPTPLGVPSPPVSGDLLGGGGGLGGLVGLLSCTPLPYDSVTQAIGPAGGTLQVGPHVLVVPEDALDSSVAITAVAPSDTVNRVQLYPEGLQFHHQAELMLSYANCNLLGSLLPKRVAYVSDALGILDYMPSLDDASSMTVRGKLDHFSGYAVAW